MTSSHTYNLNDIIQLRHALHQEPELSNNECSTAETVVSFFSRCAPDDTVSLGRTGRAFVFRGPEPGPVTVFRAELDALPIAELNDVPYVSNRQQIAHACGHDGHMAILCGLGAKIADRRPRRGTAILLFQPAEEVEQGARDVAQNPRFLDLAPDYMFALHNIPGFPLHQVLVRDGAFSAASRGMTVCLTGRTSHAAEPENGINPVFAIEKIIHAFTELAGDTSRFSDRVFLTIIHISLGEIAFGTSPGYAEVRATLRTFSDSDMATLAGRAEHIIKKIAKSEHLQHEIMFSEEFPATDNHPEAVAAVRKAARETGCHITECPEPFRWSEDFAYYAAIAKTVLFGLGSGESQPQLHNPDFNFPDEILETGISLFDALYMAYNG